MKGIFQKFQDSKKAKVLVVGSGAREHALVWKCLESPLVGEVFISSKHCGLEEKYRWGFSLKGGKEEFKKLGEKALQEKVDLVVVGPDNPLSEGIVDVLKEQGLKVFGPSEKAAQLEASKSFAKTLMEEAGIPTPRAFLFESAEHALEKLKNLNWEKPWVLKADGLALGKGVVIAQTLQEAEECLPRLFSYSGGKVLIEEFISGVELSWMAVCDGKECALLDPAQDYKKVFDGNTGPNTGGMGSYSPVETFQSLELREYVRENIFKKTISALNRRGIPFCGVLYAGLMLEPQGHGGSVLPKTYVLEFNARFGDPEAQVLLPRMEDDFFVLAYSCATGVLRDYFPKDVIFKKEKAVYVVAAAEGYPEEPILHKKIVFETPITPALKGTYPAYFLGGVHQEAHDQTFYTSGGRVLGALGVSDDLEEARNKAYQNLGRVHFQDMHFRKDIAGDI